MASTDSLALRIIPPVKAHAAGLFVSKGQWIHSERTIDSYELIFVRQGALNMHEQGRNFTITPGQALLLWPGRKHGGTEYNTEDLQFYWIHFTIPAGESVENDFFMHIPQLATISRPDRLTSLFRRYLDDQEAKCLDQTSADLLMVLMLNHMSVSQTEGESFSGTVTLVAQRAEAYIRTNFDKPLSTSLIARALDYNPDYLGRAFRTVYGTTLTTFLQRQRLNHACSLLLEGGKTVAQIARECGFDDPGYFRRVFHKLEGMSPLAYRRLYARIHINIE